MRFWIESAHTSLPQRGAACGDVVRTLTKERFAVILVSGGGGPEKAAPIADRAVYLLQAGTELERAVELLLDAIPPGEHIPFSILLVETGEGAAEAQLVECDAPPLFLTRQGRLVLLPLTEEETRGHLLRQCRFSLHDGDHLALVSAGYVRGQEQSRRWRWRDAATSIRRWTETGCDAEQLLGALIHSYHRLSEGAEERDVTVVAMHVRPLRSATVWSGPPSDPALDRAALERLLAEPGTRIICGDTTAQIAARLLGAALEMEPRPADGWAEVPPTSRLVGVSLVTEGLVTLGKAKERIADCKLQIAPCNLQSAICNSRDDGASRLARALLAADEVHFIVGLAVNPPQAADGVPLRKAAVEELAAALVSWGKIVSVEYL